MPKFLAIHTVPPGGMTVEQVQGIAQAAQQDPAVRGVRSYGSLAEGKAVCVLEAPSKEALAAWFEKMGMPFDAIHPVDVEVERGTVTRV